MNAYGLLQARFGHPAVLLKREIPFVFASSYGADGLPEAYRAVPRLRGCANGAVCFLPEAHGSLPDSYFTMWTGVPAEPQ